MYAWHLASGGHLEPDPGYAHFYPAAGPEEPSAAHEGPASGSTEAVEAQQQQLDIQQQRAAQLFQPGMQLQPQLPAHEHAGGSCAAAYYPDSGDDQQQLHAAGDVTPAGPPSHVQATGTALRPTDPQHVGGRLSTGLPASQPGVYSPAVLPQHPQLATPLRSQMRPALPLAAATHLHSRVRVALGPSAFTSIRSLMLRQQSAYRQQLSQLHMLSQVQGLLMCEVQTQTAVEDDGAFAVRQRRQQRQQRQRQQQQQQQQQRPNPLQHSPPSLPKACTPPLPPLHPSSTSGPPGWPLTPSARGVVSPLAMGPLPGGGLKRTAWQRDRDGGRVSERGGVEGEDDEGRGDISAYQRQRSRRGAKSGDVGSPQRAATELTPVGYAVSSSYAYQVALHACHHINPRFFTLLLTAP